MYASISRKPSHCRVDLLCNVWAEVTCKGKHEDAWNHRGEFAAKQLQSGQTDNR